MRHVLLLALAVAVSPLHAQEVPGRLPDPATGVMNGRVAVLVAPAEGSDASGWFAADASGCTVHTLTLNGQQKGRYPCSRWFQPPEAGPYLHWLEQGDLISQQTVLRYAGEPFAGRGLMVLKPMELAGRLRVDPAPRLNPGETLRILSLGNPKVSRSFTRRLAAGEAGTEISFPTGPALAGTFTGENDATALWRPVEVRAGERQTIAPRVTPTGTDLLVLMDRDPDPARCKARLKTRAGVLQPEVDFQNLYRLVYVWYDVQGGGSDSGTLSVECVGAARFEQQVRLPRGRVVTVRSEIKRSTGKKEPR
ncbi:MAG TPA: hypothetical protein VGF69_25955 [Thermoanaerobaculia bacterium]|jgi:hypothetical protein